MTWTNCPKCEVAIGERHKYLCDMAFCKIGGVQAIQCEVDHEHINTIFQGDFIGVQEAIERGWFAVLIEGKGWQPCESTTPDAWPDRNRVFMELKWDSDKERFI